MNRHFALLTGLLICCCVPKKTLPPAQCVGDFPLFNFGEPATSCRSKQSATPPNGDQAGKSNAAPEPATAGGHPHPKPAKKRPHCRPSQRAHFFYWRPSRSPSGKKHLIKQLRTQHAQTRARLHELSEQLAASSLRHETATRELSQANTIKDKYLRYYMQRSTFYINKLERHRTPLQDCALVRAGAPLRELRSPTPIEQEYKSFFHEFDRVFLSLYPDFVEKANALLRDGGQMKTPGLNTEFRLLAVIRLGITGNSEIASFCISP